MTKRVETAGRSRLISVNELAEYLGVPVQTVYNWNCYGNGPRFLKVGRHVRYRWTDVDAWTEAQASTSG